MSRPSSRQHFITSYFYLTLSIISNCSGFCGTDSTLIAFLSLNEAFYRKIRIYFCSLQNKLCDFCVHINANFLFMTMSWCEYKSDVAIGCHRYLCLLCLKLFSEIWPNPYRFFKMKPTLKGKKTIFAAKVWTGLKDLRCVEINQIRAQWSL